MCIPDHHQHSHRHCCLLQCFCLPAVAVSRLINGGTGVWRPLELDGHSDVRILWAAPLCVQLHFCPGWLGPPPSPPPTPKTPLLEPTSCLTSPFTPVTSPDALKQPSFHSLSLDSPPPASCFSLQSTCHQVVRRLALTSHRRCTECQECFAA